MRSVLAKKTRQAPTENNIKRTKHIRARRDSSEGLPNDVANVAKKKPLLDLQRLQRSIPSAVLLRARLCSRGRTCLSAGTCLVSLASL